VARSAAGRTHPETVREPLPAVAERREGELGEQRPPREFPAPHPEIEPPLPDGPLTVGKVGGSVRAAHQQGGCEGIAGRRVGAFRRAEADPVPAPKGFGLVQTYDQKPRRR